MKKDFITVFPTMNKKLSQLFVFQTITNINFHNGLTNIKSISKKIHNGLTNITSISKLFYLSILTAKLTFQI